jgi:hypothetical protein
MSGLPGCVVLSIKPSPEVNSDAMVVKTKG